MVIALVTTRRPFGISSVKRLGGPVEIEIRRVNGKGGAMAPKLDWSKLPPRLQYLAKPAEKYGSYQFDDKILTFLGKKATEAEKDELNAVSNRMVEDEKEINAWLDYLGITRHDEARLVYFLGHLIPLGTDNGYLQ